MALTSTVRRFEVELADSDRGVYESLDLRVAQHPSESERYLVARVLARALEHDEGLDFSRGISAGEEPALWQHDLRGDLKAWIEVGAPSVERLHKASKLGARVSVYSWKAPEQLAKDIAAQGIHRGDEVAIHMLPASLLDEIIGTLDRNNRWEVSVSGATLYLNASGKSWQSELVRVPIPTGTP